MCQSTFKNCRLHSLTCSPFIRMPSSKLLVAPSDFLFVGVCVFFTRGMSIFLPLFALVIFASCLLATFCLGILAHPSVMALIRQLQGIHLSTGKNDRTGKVASALDTSCTS